MGRHAVSRGFAAFLLLVCLTSVAADEGRWLIRFSTSGEDVRDLRARIDIVRSFGTSYLGLVDREDLDALEAKGTSFEILDRDPAAYGYYILFSRSVEQLEEVGSLTKVLTREGGMVLVRATPEEAEDLKGLGPKVEELSLDPIRLVSDPKVPAPDFAPSGTAIMDGFLSGGAASTSTAADPSIEEMVAAVDTSSLEALVNDLVSNGGYGTRRANTQGGVAAAEFIHGEFESYGFSGVNLSYEDIDEGLDVFSDNVVAEIPGTVHPEEIVILGAHYDSVCGSWSSPCNGDPDSSAPGADDNATGTAAVLETARILSGYEFEKTIRFVTFSAEEFVLVGSQYHADQAAVRAENIVAMVNIDMIGYVANGDIPDVDLIVQDDIGTGDDATVAAADALRDQAIDAIDTYVTGFGRIREWAGSGWGATTDHRPFHRKGWPAIWFFEDKADYSPFIHTDADTVGPSLNDWDFMMDCTRSVVATLATFAVPFEEDPPPPPPPPPDWEVAPAQTGRAGMSAREPSVAVLMNHAALVLIPFAYLLLLRRRAANRTSS